MNLIQIARAVHISNDEQAEIRPSQQNLSVAQIKKIEEIISNDWDNYHSLKDLAREIGTNECYLKRNFKAQYGLPINAYRQKMKMAHAVDLLLNSDQSVKEIAQSIGFKHSTHFCKAFKKIHLLTPVEYRSKSCK